LSAKLVPAFVDGGVLRSQRDGSPTAVILIFLDRSRYFIDRSRTKATELLVINILSLFKKKIHVMWHKFFRYFAFRGKERADELN
jgi:hypothetical protein